MATVKERAHQELLAAVAVKMHSGETVSVRIHPNPKDSNAIAFECQIESQLEENWLCGT